jgi:hypothetical protein
MDEIIIGDIFCRFTGVKDIIETTGGGIMELLRNEGKNRFPADLIRIQRKCPVDINNNPVRKRQQSLSMHSVSRGKMCLPMPNNTLSNITS